MLSRKLVRCLLSVCPHAALPVFVTPATCSRVCHSDFVAVAAPFPRDMFKLLDYTQFPLNETETCIICCDGT